MLCMQVANKTLLTAAAVISTNIYKGGNLLEDAVNEGYRGVIKDTFYISYLDNFLSLVESMVCVLGSGNIFGMDLAMFLELTQKLFLSKKFKMDMNMIKKKIEYHEWTNSINFLMLDYTAQKDKDAYAGDFVNIK
ncbi:hypothetical protein ACJX0J_012185, partial [Zea mays]